MRAVNPVPTPLVSRTVPPAELKFNVIDDARADVRLRKLVARTASPRVVRDLFFMVWMCFVGLGTENGWFKIQIADCQTGWS
jgi:hypothetical protein